MSAPIGPIVLFTRCVPPWPLGRNTLTVTQHLAVSSTDDPHADPTEGPRLLEATGGTLHLEVVGSATDLPPGEVLATCPAAGDEHAAPNLLPSVILRRRTLPWERPVGQLPPHSPWLAVLTLLDADPEAGTPAEYTRSVGTREGVACDLVTVPSTALAAILPRREELALLAHARQVSLEDRERLGDDDGFVAVVAGARLPTPGRAHTAFLVSLVGVPREVFPPGLPIPRPVAHTTTFTVLHAWSFRAAEGTGADFESLMHALQPRVARFGTTAAGVHPAVPLAWRATDGTDATVGYRGPLQPFPMEVPETADQAAEGWWIGPDGTLDASRAAAFELGRLLASASPELVGDLERARHARVHTKLSVGLTPPWVPHADARPTGPASDGPDFGFPVRAEVMAGLRAGVATRLAGPEADPLRLGAARPIAATADEALTTQVIEVAAEVFHERHQEGLGARLERALPALVQAVTRGGMR